MLHLKIFLKGTIFVQQQCEPLHEYQEGRNENGNGDSGKIEKGMNGEGHEEEGVTGFMEGFQIRWSP